MLPSFLLGGAVGNAIRPYYNAWQIGRGYDRLKTNPYQGKGTDVITKMKNHNGETVMMQRGEAIPGENGEVIAHGGNAFKRITGTKSNYGLNKAIYKHGVPRDEVTKIPHVIKKKPIETTEFGQDVYLYKSNGENMRVVTSPRDNIKTLSTIYKVER